MGINLAGLAGFLLGLAAARHWWLEPIWGLAVILAATAGPVIALEALTINRHLWRRAEQPADREFWIRIALKHLGLGATLGVILFLYWLFPAWRYASGVHLLVEMIEAIWPALAIATPVYMVWTDRRMAAPRDAYWMIGAGLVGRAEWRADMLREHALGWGVKAFFLPLMLGFLAKDFAWARELWPPHDLFGPWERTFETAYRFAFMIDVSFAVAGYMLTLRAIGGHIRSTEPSLLGWAVCLACYPPFWDVAGAQYLAYEDGRHWGAWLWAYPALKLVWAVAILALVAVYVWATVVFGVRFSNLTHRGILTNGPYRYTKHPAYIAKNLSWWMIATPFLSEAGAEDALRNSILLLGVNALYAARAWTEERHLARDPIYIAYAQWIAEHGLFARLGRFSARVSIWAFGRPLAGWRVGFSPRAR